MIQTVQHYLTLLKKELAGCDRATIQDALANTEEHLNTALENAAADGSISKSEALAQVIEEYGTPEEVARGYREIEYRVTPALAVASDTAMEPDKAESEEKGPLLNRLFGVYADSRTWGSILYLLFSMATGIIYFTWVVTGLSLSAGLLVLIVGLPIAGLFILSVRGIGLVEGLIVEALLGIRMPRRQAYQQRNLGWWERFRQLITDKHTWLTMIYLMLQMPLGIAYFTIFTTLTAVSFYFIFLPLLQLGFNVPVASVNGAYYYMVTWMLPLTVIFGAALATGTLHLARLLGRWHGTMAKALLVRI
jgi:uncharacterized membrane protein